MSLHPGDVDLGAARAVDVPTDDALVAAVQVLRWPAEAGVRDPSRPCLWLLPVGELAPLDQPGDGWVRVPVDERELRARVERLASRVEAPGVLQPGEVRVDLHGRVERCGVAVHLPPIEAHILAELGTRPDQVVTRETLSRSVWGEHEPGGRALDSRIHALRGRIGPLGLAIHTIRGRGFLLTAADPARTAFGAPRPCGR